MHDKNLHIWKASLLAFVIAAATGLFFRIGMIDGFSAGFEPAHIRHAHSHLMLMGWVTPAAMALMAALWHKLGPTNTHRLCTPAGPKTRLTIWLSWLFAMLCFQPFLAHGYQSYDIGFATMPLAPILSGFAMIAWYGFAAAYAHATWKRPRTAALRAFDIAIIFLVISSLGAWGEAALIAARVTDPFWLTLMIHIFVDLFGEGWLVFATLGLIYTRNDQPLTPLLRTSNALMLSGLTTLYFLALPAHLTRPPFQYLASAGALLYGLGLLGHLRTLWPLTKTHKNLQPALGLLAIKAAAMIAAGIPFIARWAQSSGLRLLYLHIIFLGFVSITLIALARETFGPHAFRFPRSFQASVLLLLLSLIPLTSLWPTALIGRWMLYTAAAAAALPLLITAGALLPPSTKN